VRPRRPRAWRKLAGPAASCPPSPSLSPLPSITRTKTSGARFPTPGRVIDGSGSRRFERNSLGRCLHYLHSVHAQTSRWLRQCKGKLIPIGIQGEGGVCGISKLCPLLSTPTKKKKKKTIRKKLKTALQGNVKTMRR
jgi:hypothetical protein